MFLSNRLKFQVGSEIAGSGKISSRRSQSSHVQLVVPSRFSFFKHTDSKKTFQERDHFQTGSSVKTWLSRFSLLFCLQHWLRAYVEFLGGMAVRVDELGASSTSIIRLYNGGGRDGEMSRDSDSCFGSVNGIKQREPVTNL